MWDVTTLDNLSLFISFHSGSLDLGMINRSYLIFLSNKDSVEPPSDFCLVYLQSCPLKFISKVLDYRPHALC